MRQKNQYHVRWKGVQTGPYPIDEIKHKLEIGEYGLMHEVYKDGQWITISRLLSQHSTPENSPAPTPFFFQNVPRKKTLKEPDQDEPSSVDNYSFNGILFILTLAGYLCCIAALFVFPSALGMAGFIIGSLNIVLKNRYHGILQIFFSIFCFYLGLTHYAILK